ncbi:MAG: DNA polymerase Y family protein [Acidimicrobiales bacterium]
MFDTRVMGSGVVRVAVVWCPDWPVVAHRRPDEAVVVVHANRVVAASWSARAHGIVGGLRRREAQSRCPGVVVLERDLDLEARSFEAVVGALDDLTPRTEIIRPGILAFPTRGPSRYFGGDAPMAHRCRTVAGTALQDLGADVRIGIADSVFAATVAARTPSDSRVAGGGAGQSHAGSVPGEDTAGAPGGVADGTAADRGITIVAPGETAAFLAPRSIRLLDRPDLVDVCLRLGVHTLGAYAALDPVDVAGRFGADGSEAHRLASGLDLRPPALVDPPPEMEVAAELDPPVERVDQAAFMGKALADELLARLDERGASCSRIVICAETEHGEELVRRWRHDGALTAAAIADRVRWQLDGWLNGSSRGRPTGAISRLSVRPDELGPMRGRQLGFWGGRAENIDTVARTVARVQGLLGAEAVRVPEARAGRSPQEQIVTVPADAVDLGRDHIAGAAGIGAGGGGDPWPGALPGTPPVRVHDPPVPAEVVDATGAAIAVDARAQLSAAPAVLVVDGAAPLTVGSWAGPWPLDERWWDPERQRRRARLQMVTEDQVARLVVIEGGRWWVEATYD